MRTENDEETSDPLLAPINSDGEEPSKDDRSLTPVVKSKRSRQSPRYKMGSYSETVKGEGEWHIVLTGGKPLPDWSGQHLHLHLDFVDGKAQSNGNKVPFMCK